MDDDEKQTLTNAGAQLALAELLRHVIGEVFFSEDPEDFRKKLSRLEETTVAGIHNRNWWPAASEEANTFAKEAAANWVGQIIAGVVYPSNKTRSG